MKHKLIKLIAAIQLTLSLFVLPMNNVSSSTTNDNPTSQTNNNNLLKYQEQIYTNAIKHFKKISVQKLNKLVGKKKITVFWGKKSCPFCRAFVPKLAKIGHQRHIKIYYIDTTKTDSNSALKKARKRFKVTGVPTLMKIKNNKKFVIMDRTRTDLTHFLTKKYSN
ncbi:conjugal transfer protein TraF [Lactobacillus sp. ESL0731]|uniref:conjugal transfer protein TraF n=1 Tax=unclassified Lactobacillus TaxID=2620435 RepID=UPI0023F75292|nr:MULTISPECIES: conjugal transfer protein TraF [unclassified Lactobacillus]WEV51262.1 conjugal transfer protein TraF [Lactobacillus sp. ESL0700]WEV62392.1 conjugal transfer protein TraF [Lactobacillus sp. ESL0731]